MQKNALKFAVSLIEIGKSGESFVFTENVGDDTRLARSEIILDVLRCYFIMTEIIQRSDQRLFR